MKTKIKFKLLVLSFCLSGIVQASSEQSYEMSEKILNQKYALIQGFVKTTPSEKQSLFNQQNQWLKARNTKCKFKENSPLSLEIKNCVSQENQKRIQFFQSQYFNFSSLEQNLIRPITYNKQGQKILANNSCFCDGEMLKIKNNQLYIYSACDEKLTEPKTYKILKKTKTETSIEYAIDTNNDQIADFIISFVISGQNTWKIVPKAYKKQDLISLNFNVNYTTSPQVKKIDQDCGDFDG